ncbi:MAG TPA: amidohydrolase family protein [Bryobacteraceae bacterium]|nr:amidohydrolase family protein [Bryobacteraceae bacterium]
MSRLRYRIPICLLAFFLETIAHSQPIAISAGTLIDPASGEEKRNQVLLIEDGKIKEFGPSVKVPANASRIDLSSETVLPGLVDAHTHLLATVDPKWDLGDFWIMAMQRRAGFRMAQGVRHAKEMLESGFTTVRDVGNAGDYLDADLEKAIRFGIIPGPTMIFAGRIIAPFGGQFWDTPADRKLLENPEYRFADSQDELRRAVRENIYWGARVIKIVVDGQKYVYSADDIRFVVQEAQRAGVKVAAHVQTERGARAAIEAGVASIEHGWVLSDEDLALAKKNHVTLVSTDFTVAELIANGMEPDAAKRTHERYVARLKRASLAGVNIVFGTDIMSDIKGKTRGQAAMDYVDSFTEAGVGPIDILRAMTSRAVDLLGVASERGALEKGMAADLVATPLDPLRDINGLKSIDFVMKNGEVWRRR